jgi:hypothetical protein
MYVMNFTLSLLLSFAMFGTIMGVPGGGAATPPSLLGKQSQSGNIRFTVGQYWLIIKLNGTNSVNFVRNSVNFVGNMLTGNFRNHSSPHRRGGGGGGGGVITTRAQSEKVG